MSAEVTLEMIRKTAALMAANNMPPRTVKTRKEARALTTNDPAGRVWKVGDEYYLLVEKDGQRAIAP